MSPEIHLLRQPISIAHATERRGSEQYNAVGKFHSQERLEGGFKPIRSRVEQIGVGWNKRSFQPWQPAGPLRCYAPSHPVSNWLRNNL